MNVILSKWFDFGTNSDVRAYLAAFASHMDDVENGCDLPSTFDSEFIRDDVDDIRIGRQEIYIKLRGRDDFTHIGSRREYRSAAIDGSPYALHGDAFRRLHCVRTQERYDVAVEALKTEAQRRIDDIRSYAAEREAAITEELTTRLNRLAEEFAADQTAESTQDGESTQDQD